MEEAPHSVHQVYSQCPGLRDGARTILDKRREVVPATRSLYLTIREFAITHNHDTKIDIIGTDNLVNNVVLIIKNTGTIWIYIVIILKNQDAKLLLAALAITTF